MSYNKFIEIVVIFLPIISVFLTGMFFPVNNKGYKPVFQPPNWVFPVIWTYITLGFGYFSNQLLLIEQVRTNLYLYLTILINLNVWLVIYSKKWYATSFYILIITSYLSIIYLRILAKHNIKYSSLLLVMPFWLILASCLNGVIYDRTG